MEIFECSSCGDVATKQTIVDGVYVCNDDDCLLELAKEHFIDNDVDLDVIYSSIDDIVEEE